MPHPLPDDVNNVTGLKWFLAAVPDDPAFTRAAWDIFTEMGNYWKWGKEGPVPADSDKAAQLWTNAIYETIEAYKMGFPDVLLGHIDEVEDLLRALQSFNQLANPCCADNIGVINEEIETDLIPGGDPPDTWGDGEVVADAADWEELVCGAAHAYVDLLKNMSDELQQYANLGIITVGGIATILGILSGAGIVLGIAYGSAAAVVSGIIAGITEGLFGDASADLETARQNIVCEVFGGDGDTFSQAVEDAVSPLAWSLFYQFVDYSSARNAMLEGSHGSETLGVNRRDDCDCGIDFDFLHTADQADLQANVTNWTATGTGIQSNGSGDCTGLYFYNLDVNGDNIQTRVLDSAAHEAYTLPSNYLSYLMQVEFDICAIYNTVRLTVTYNDGTSETADYTTAGTKQFVPTNAGIKAVSNGGTYGNGVGIRAQGAPGGAITGMRLWWKVEEVV